MSASESCSLVFDRTVCTTVQATKRASHSLMAQDHNIPYITFFINLAPPPISLNEASCGWDMTSGQVQPFANYLATVVSHWKTDGINVAYISPMNEPINNRRSCGQEGMGVSLFLRGSVFAAVKAALRNASKAMSE